MHAWLQHKPLAVRDQPAKVLAIWQNFILAILLYKAANPPMFCCPPKCLLAAIRQSFLPPKYVYIAIYSLCHIQHKVQLAKWSVQTSELLIASQYILSFVLVFAILCFHMEEQPCRISQSTLHAYTIQLATGAHIQLRSPAFSLTALRDRLASY